MCDQIRRPCWAGPAFFWPLQSCSCLSLDTAELVPALTGNLALHWGEMAPPFTTGNGKLTLTAWASGLTSSATTLAHSTHPNIYPIQDCLELIKGPVPWDDSRRIPADLGQLGDIPEELQ